MAIELPAELWLQIFAYALDDTSLFDHSLATPMTDSLWHKLIYGDWSLQSPEEGTKALQRRVYATIKAIMATCKFWNRLGAEFLFRFLFFSNPLLLRKLRTVLDCDKTLGSRTKRIHLADYKTASGVQDALVYIIRRCPKLEIFIANRSLFDSLHPTIDALRMSCRKSLQVLQLNLHPIDLAKFILMLEDMPSLVCIHLDFEGIRPESLASGSWSGIALSLPKLRQLSLRGTFQDFFEEAIGWDLPSLVSLSLDFLSHHEDLPDITEFLASHGEQLDYLDVNCVQTLDVAAILDLCPLLTTFAFNPDWRLPPSEQNQLQSRLVNHPHQSITTIGLHQLLHAFGVGDAASNAEKNPIPALLTRRSNDMNFAAITKHNFPRIERVRVLNRTLLRDLELADGPGQDCFERWERWWDQCAIQKIRLEDCTGAPLGTLPELEDEESDAETESELDTRTAAETEARSRHTLELRELLEQCRQMSATREEPMFPPPGYGYDWGLDYDDDEFD